MKKWGLQKMTRLYKNVDTLEIKDSIHILAKNKYVSMFLVLSNTHLAIVTLCDGKKKGNNLNNP